MWPELPWFLKCLKFWIGNVKKHGFSLEIPVSCCFPLGRPWESSSLMDIFVLVLSKVNWAQDPSSEVPDCWFYWLHLHSMGQVFWSRRSVQLYRSQRSHYKHGNSAPWMCPPTLTTACKVWPSFTKCKTRNECFFRHQFISWLLKSIWEFGGEIRGFLKSECWRCPEDFFLTEVWVALHCNWST